MVRIRIKGFISGYSLLRTLRLRFLSTMPASRKHSNSAKQYNQALFLCLVDELGNDAEFCASVQSSSSPARTEYLCKQILAKAISVGLSISSNPIQYVSSRLGNNNSCCSYENSQLKRLWKSSKLSFFDVVNKQCEVVSHDCFSSFSYFGI